MLNPYDIALDQLTPGAQMGLKLVAVVGQNHDWAAYAGPIDWPNQRVAKEGDKISEEAAELIFYAPYDAGLTYRR